TMSAEDRLDQLLLRWHKLDSQGQNVTAAELCRDSPDLLPELARRIGVLREMQSLVLPLLGAAGVAVAPAQDLAAGHTPPDAFASSAPDGPPQPRGDQSPAGADRTWRLSVVLRPPQQPDELGRLGGYRVLRVLGEGGMGLVFLAEDPVLRRPLVLKVIKPEYAVHADARQRFLREARAAAALAHDHIMPVYQVGE